MRAARTDKQLDVVGIAAINEDIILTVAAGSKLSVDSGGEVIVSDEEMDHRLAEIADDDQRRDHGGSTFNVLHALARMDIGLTLGLVGAEGQADRGTAEVGSDLLRPWVETGQVWRVEAPPGRCLSAPKYRARGLTTALGANAELGGLLAANHQQVVDYCKRARVLHTSSFLDSETTHRVARVLAAVKDSGTGTSISVDPGTVWVDWLTQGVGEERGAPSQEAADDVGAILKLADFVFLNEGEFYALGKGDRNDDPGRYADRVLKTTDLRPEGQDPPVVVLKTRGESILFSRGLDDEVRIRSEVIADGEVVDDTGAGDVFAAGFLAGLLVVEDRPNTFGASLGGVLAAAKHRTEGTSGYAEFRALAHTRFRRLYAAQAQPPDRLPPWLRPRSSGGGRKVVVVGAAVTDVLAWPAQLPEAGGEHARIALDVGATYRSPKGVTVPGGKGLVQAVAASRLGGNVTLIAAIGDDAAGLAILDVLDRERVELQPPPVPGMRTAVTTVLTAEHGSSFVTTLEQPENARLSDANAGEAARRALREADIILVTLEASPIALAWVEKELQRRRDHRLDGVSVLRASPRWVPRPDDPQTPGFLSLFDHIVLRPHDATTVHRTDSGKLPTDDAQTLLKTLGDRPGKFIITLADKGYVYLSKDGPVDQAAWKVQSVDARGTSDAFCAALGMWLGHGVDLETSLDLANCAGGWAVQTAGGYESMPNVGELFNMDIHRAPEQPQLKGKGDDVVDLGAANASLLNDELGELAVLAGGALSAADAKLLLQAVDDLRKKLVAERPRHELIARLSGWLGVLADLGDTGDLGVKLVRTLKDLLV